MAVPGAEESFPFWDDDLLVFKVMGKMFCIVSLAPKDGVYRPYMKCDPERSLELRERYDGVQPGHYKTLMWNAVALGSDVPDELVTELIRHSVEQVIAKLPRRLREEYEGKVSASE